MKSFERMYLVSVPFPVSVKLFGKQITDNVVNKEVTRYLWNIKIK